VERGGVITLNQESQATWVERDLEHLRYEYDLNPTDLVIDIGAHAGEFSNRIFELYGCRIIAVEPTGYIDGFRNGEVINEAASDYDGQQSFGGLSLYTSIYEPAAHRYPCFDINKLLAEHSEIALLKINIEGGEYRLLKRILQGEMQTRIRNLQIQFHQVEDQPWSDWYTQITDQLSETHGIQWRYPFCWESWNRNA
jgi:FkbM family methyltransferase